VSRFEIEGTTLLSWSTRVEAQTQAEAIEQAQRIAGLVEGSAEALSVHSLHHRITRCQNGAGEDQA
jgi:hypothetical protein